MIWIKTEEENTSVTEFYLHTIGHALEYASEGGNQQIRYVSDIRKIKPESGDTVVISTAPSVLRFLHKNVKIVYWAQGAWPEESMLRHSSKIRFFITGMLEKTALKRADYVFFVSDHMRLHFERKYRLSFDGHYYLMPCSNDSFHEKAFEEKQRYFNNVFCYAGATSVWQCFEETVALYAKIEKHVSNSRLLLLVKDRELAEQTLAKYQVKNYEIDFVSVAQLPEKLKDVKYGFMLRKPSVVNEVATPTKTLTYLSNGVIPIYSNCLKGISELFRDCKYKIEIQDGKELDRILQAINEPVNQTEIFEEYKRIYHQFYDAQAHIPKIASSLKEAGIV